MEIQGLLAGAHKCWRELDLSGNLKGAVGRHGTKEVIVKGPLTQTILMTYHIGKESETIAGLTA